MKVNTEKYSVKTMIVEDHNFLSKRSLYFFRSFLYFFDSKIFDFLPKCSIKMFVNHKLWVIDQSDNFFMVGLLYLVHCLKGLTKGSVEKD